MTQRLLKEIVSEANQTQKCWAKIVVEEAIQSIVSLNSKRDCKKYLQESFRPERAEGAQKLYGPGQTVTCFSGSYGNCKVQGPVVQ